MVFAARYKSPLFLSTIAVSSMLMSGCQDVELLPELAEDFPEIVKEHGKSLKKPLVWGECPEGFASECTRLTVPTRWLDPAGETIEIMLSRRPATSGRSKGQVWLLDGGPGGDAAGLGPLVDDLFPDLLPDYDVYVMQHRGTGVSTRLTCPEQEDPESEGGVGITPGELPVCLQYLDDTWGEDLEGFRITNAARDLAYSILRTAKPNDEVFVYGLSYGTLLAQRFMQIAPDLADGVILDSVLPTTGASFFEFDLQFDPVGQSIAETCAADAFCASKMGEDPWGRIVALMDKLDGGHCAGLGLGSLDVGSLASSMAANDTLRRHIMPLVYRIDRCDDADIAVVGNYLETLNMLFGPPPEEIPGYSDLLFQNIAFVEINDNVGGVVPSFDEVLERCIDATLCPFASVGARPNFDVWPTYEPDVYFRKPLQVATPVLAMNGTLDPQTPLAMASIIEPQLDSPHQSFVVVPESPHIVLLRAHDEDPSKPTCGAQLMRSFIDAPKAAVDTSCVSTLRKLDFDVIEPESAFFFGTPEEWENDAAVRAYSMYPRDLTALSRTLKTLRPWEIEKRLRSISALR